MLNTLRRGGMRPTATAAWVGLIEVLLAGLCFASMRAWQTQRGAA